eukprot:4747859-Pyramimonas_sp.AAC.2
MAFLKMTSGARYMLNVRALSGRIRGARYMLNVRAFSEMSNRGRVACSIVFVVCWRLFARNVV